MRYVEMTHYSYAELMFMLIFSLASPIDNSQTEMAQVFFGKQFFFSNLLGRLENADFVFFFIE